MIGKLRGLVDEVGADEVVIDCGGVGYVVSCSARTLEALPAVGQPATLFIETYVREDQIRLIGFGSAAEREWFRLLLSVQGVGTKVALGVLSTLKPADLATAIARQDKVRIATAPGVGPKVAQRIATELKDKVPALAMVDPRAATAAGAAEVKVAPGASADAVSALVNLGYAEAQAAQAVAGALEEAGEGAATALLIRTALKKLAAR
jgi:Holliday junction DNA helicase RuvA